MKEQGKRIPLEERNLPPETIKKLLQMLNEKLKNSPAIQQKLKDK